MNKKIALTLVVLAVLIVGTNMSIYTVHQTQQALVLQFGSPQRVERNPGLHFKTPILENVEYYDRRILNLDPRPQEVLLIDRERINLDAYARYRIVDPLEYRKKAVTDANFVGLFGERLNSSVRDAVAKVRLSDLLTGKRSEIMNSISDSLKVQAKEFGIEVVDVRIVRSDLPIKVSQSVFDRMRSERIAQAKQLRAEGEEIKARIQAEAERDRTIILAEARKKSQILRGEGDGERTRILVEAYDQDRDFFAFYRSLEAYGLALGTGTTMVLSPDSEFFRFFGDITGRSTDKTGQ